METITLTGSTGYIGLRLIPRLLEKGYKLKCVARDPSYLLNREFTDKIEIVKADFKTEENLDLAFKGSNYAYYLIHSMSDSERFEDIEKTCANNFARFAKRNKIKKVVYLGGLF
ncbi:MAG: NAD(P)H-binding protein [Elusimicrobiota bacterium]